MRYNTILNIAKYALKKQVNVLIINNNYHLQIIIVMCRSQGVPGALAHPRIFLWMGYYL